MWSLGEPLLISRTPGQAIDAATLFDLVKLAFGAVAGAGALVALVVDYRRQRVDEDGALRDATRLHTERFTTAESQRASPPPSPSSATHPQPYASAVFTH
ncbi:hypothetical protein ACFU96_32045 [Streptomyces sp. NPDC057620]|uniref:hypothetical protein n=1 Tax=Streptomyces sp. NPDC057620 TaxID=3346185 RepID=UPI0036A94199